MLQWLLSFNSHLRLFIPDSYIYLIGTYEKYNNNKLYLLIFNELLYIYTIQHLAPVSVNDMHQIAVHDRFM